MLKKEGDAMLKKEGCDVKKMIIRAKRGRKNNILGTLNIGKQSENAVKITQNQTLTLSVSDCKLL